MDRAPLLQVLAAVLGLAVPDRHVDEQGLFRALAVRPVHDRLVASRRSVTAVPLGRVAVIGVERQIDPSRNTLFNSAIASTLPDGTSVGRSEAVHAARPYTVVLPGPQDVSIGRGCHESSSRSCPDRERSAVSSRGSGSASVVAAAAAGAVVLSSSPRALLGLDVGRRGHRLVDQVVDQLGVDLQDQLAEDHVAQAAVGDDLLERPVGPEVGQEVRPLLVASTG